MCEGCESKGKKEVEWDSWMEKEVGGGVAVRFELETPETERRTRGRCTGISRFIALQLSHFLQIEGLWKPCMEQVLSVSFFQQYLLTLHLCCIVVILKILQTLYQQKDYDLLKAQMIFNIFLAIKYF